MQPVLELARSDGFCLWPVAAGGLRVVDDSTGTTFVPGCCDGLEDWREWRRLFSAGGIIGYGHPPVSPLAERVGDTILLTVDAEQDDSPTIELTDQDLSRMLAGVEGDLTGLLALVADWAQQHLPGRETALTAAIARTLDLPVP